MNFRNYLLSTLLFLIFFSNSNAQQFEKIEKLEIPELKNEEQFVCHLAYCLSYNEAYEQASWVAYELYGNKLNGGIKRTNHFIPDPAIKTKSAENRDYLGKGYDRGHLAPAGDMTWSRQAMDESFYYSNISPQLPAFNRGIWENIEEFVRLNARIEGSLYVVTGPVLRKGLPVIGPNEVAVPEYFYKVLLVYNKDKIKGIGILIPNKDVDGPINKYAISINEIEKVTGINFFPLLPDDLEKKVEHQFDLTNWKWNSTIHNNLFSEGGKEIEISSKKSFSTRCSGLTKKGTRCKRKTTNTNGRCDVH